jgi:long-chain acyl-CoA synthetase
VLKLVLIYKMNPEKAFELIEVERITHLHGVPTMTWEILQSPDLATRDISSLVGVGGGGAARPPEHVRQIGSKFPKGVAPGIGYGLTETNALGTNISGIEYVERPSSVGRPVSPLVRIDVIDAKGNVVGPGIEGEIRIFGAANMRCYWNKPAETSQVLRGGCIYTGDIGKLDAEGFLYITDRKKDIVIRGGENISCGEVEAAIYEHPSVFEAAVYGLSDDRLGETLAAAIVVKGGLDVTEAELRAHLSKRLAAYKIPEHWTFGRDLLPRVASGKIDKQQLRRSRGAVKAS